MKLDPSRVTFTVEALPEDLPVRGNVQVSGNPLSDRSAESRIIRRLEAGDLWAWCVVKVTARLGPFEGKTYLGGCSYKDEKDFRRGGYLEDMMREAQDELEAEMQKAATVLEESGFLQPEA